ncbi:MAG: DPP IV N-terminal domain-containing protein [Saprospirales bacterium]|nr:DPP IV N-terminal domain-containing protein [Saprospirales bacterium]
MRRSLARWTARYGSHILEPGGTRLAFIRFDESAVPQYPLSWYSGGLYPRYTEFKYPKVGAPNSRVSVQV